MKNAVVLFNLGGPDCQENVKPFLFNLFNDPAIISAPKIIRFLLAKFISSRRQKKAQKIYSYIGGKSPILELTKQQAQELELVLGDKYKVFVSMRYWHPMAKEVSQQIKDYAPDNIIFLPLYPQFSTTTSASSIKSFPLKPNKVICCYPLEEGFINAHAQLIKPELEKFPNARILFSAHGLPKKVIEAKDPYQWQVEQTAMAIAKKLQVKDFVVCYQSKVGPLEWLKPNTEDEILRAAKDNVPIILTPVAFVSEHSETLVELDIQFKELAQNAGVKNYIRIPALGTNKLFIESLANLVKAENSSRICPKEFCKCFRH